jgi:hypothetical protein
MKLIQWPTTQPPPKPKPQELRIFQSCCEQLTHVQLLYVYALSSDFRTKLLEMTSSTDNVLRLWITDELVRPFVIRFRYHFYGDKKTNKIDKVRSNLQKLTFVQPEWIFTYVQKILSEYGGILEITRPLVAKLLGDNERTYANLLSRIEIVDPLVSNNSY